MKQTIYIALFASIFIFSFTHLQVPGKVQVKDSLAGTGLGVSHLIIIPASPERAPLYKGPPLDSLNAWQEFKKLAMEKLDNNAKSVTQLKVSIPEGSDAVKRNYLKKINDLENRNDNLRMNLTVIRDLDRESLIIFRNHFNAENITLTNEIQLLLKTNK